MFSSEQEQRLKGLIDGVSPEASGSLAHHLDSSSPEARCVAQASPKRLKHQSRSPIDFSIKHHSVAFCSPAKSLTFSGLIEHPIVGKKLFSPNIPWQSAPSSMAPWKALQLVGSTNSNPKLHGHGSKSRLASSEHPQSNH